LLELLTRSATDVAPKDLPALSSEAWDVSPDAALDVAFMTELRDEADVATRIISIVKELRV